MKQIIHRSNGQFLSIEEARTLLSQLKRLGLTCVEHRSVYGYANPELATKANLRAVLETYEGYTFAFVGTEYISFEGYKVLVIGFKNFHAPTFEKNFPNYIVIGN